MNDYFSRVYPPTAAGEQPLAGNDGLPVEPSEPAAGEQPRQRWRWLAWLWYLCHEAFFLACVYTLLRYPAASLPGDVWSTFCGVGLALALWGITIAIWLRCSTVALTRRQL